MKKLTKYIPLIPVALVLGAMMFPSGCANTTIGLYMFMKYGMKYNQQNKR